MKYPALFRMSSASKLLNVLRVDIVDAAPLTATCPGKVWLTDQLDMTLMGGLGRNTSTQSTSGIELLLDRLIVFCRLDPFVSALFCVLCLTFYFFT